MSKHTYGRSILSLGSVNIDIVFSVPHIVRPGETLHSSSVQIHLGGKGANQAAAAARTGVKTFFAGRIGADGEHLISRMRESGVDCAYLETGKGKTGQALIQVSSSGENSIILYQGENHGFTGEYIDRVLSSFTRDDVLILQNEINLMPEVIRRARAQGLHVIFNPAPFGPEVAEYPLDLVDTLVLNEIEASSLTGMPEESPQQLIRASGERCPQAEVILTLGSKGALHLAKGEVRVIAPRKVKAVDTTSAGDTFIGYYAGALVRGFSRDYALDAATRAAAICVTRHGASSSIPNWDEVFG